MVCATLIVLHGDESVRYTKGQTMEQAILARVTFHKEEPLETDQARERAGRESPSYYRLNEDLIASIQGQLQNLHAAGRANETYEKFKAAVGKFDWPVTETAYGELRKLVDDDGVERFRKLVAGLGESLKGEYFVRPLTREDRDPPPTADSVMLVGAKERDSSGSPDEAVKVNKYNLQFITAGESVQGRATVLALPFPFALRPVVREILEQSLKAEPLFEFDREKTYAEMELAESRVPQAFTTYQAGKPIVEAGELDEADVALLALEHAEYLRYLDSSDPAAAALRTQRFAQRLGTTVLIFLVTLTLAIHFGYYESWALHSRTKIMGTTAVLLLMLVLVRALGMRLAVDEVAVLAAVLGAAVLTIGISQRVALICASALAFLIALSTHGGLGLFVTLIAAVAVTVFGLGDIRTRSRIMGVGTLAAATSFVATFAVGLADRQDVGYVTVHAGWAALSAILAALVVQGTLPLIERLFRVATSMTLMEWKDASKPLLRRLAHAAPGTYNHSLVLATMADSACEAIGANGLLTQVGALYHDVGKIHKADYFAENQEAHINRHDNLSPTMSHLIIIGHVKDGIEMAKEYGVPRVLHQFIAEHHGTTVVRYFHHRATEQHPLKTHGRHDREVPEEQFRYQGPKPQSKESAILMLCDGVEGAVRAVQEPTPGRIESTVHQVLVARLNDGQFDDCDITLKELHAVEVALAKSLTRFYHGRVAYPKAEPKAAPAQTQPA